MLTKIHIVGLFCLLSLVAHSQVPDTAGSLTDTSYTVKVPDSLINCRYTADGIASYYNNAFNGRRTANGEIFSNSLMTAAHKTLPLGTYVRVTNLNNCKVVVVKINDRMPYWNKREIDLTYNAAVKLDFVRAGLARVRVEALGRK